MRTLPRRRRGISLHRIPELCEVISKNCRHNAQIEMCDSMHPGLDESRLRTLIEYSLDAMPSSSPTVGPLCQPFHRPLLGYAPEEFIIA